MIVSANGLLKMYLSFPFIISFIVTMNSMSIIKPISIKLQKRCTDIVKSYIDVKDVLHELRAVRQSEEMLHSWFVQAEAIAFKVGVVSEVSECLLDKPSQTMWNIVLWKSTIEEILFFLCWTI